MKFLCTGRKVTVAPARTAEGNANDLASLTTTSRGQSINRASLGTAPRVKRNGAIDATEQHQLGKKTAGKGEGSEGAQRKPGLFEHSNINIDKRSKNGGEKNKDSNVGDRNRGFLGTGISLSARGFKPDLRLSAALGLFTQNSSIPPPPDGRFGLKAQVVAKSSTSESGDIDSTCDALPSGFMVSMKTKVLNSDAIKFAYDSPELEDIRKLYPEIIFEIRSLITEVVGNSTHSNKLEPAQKDMIALALIRFFEYPEKEVSLDKVEVVIKALVGYDFNKALNYVPEGKLRLDTAGPFDVLRILGNSGGFGAETVKALLKPINKLIEQKHDFTAPDIHLWAKAVTEFAYKNNRHSPGKTTADANRILKKLQEQVPEWDINAPYHYSNDQKQIRVGLGNSWVGSSRLLAMGARKKDLRRRIPALVLSALASKANNPKFIPGLQQTIAIRAIQNGISNDLPGSPLDYGENRLRKVKTWVERTRQSKRLRNMFHKTPFNGFVNVGALDVHDSVIKAMRVNGIAATLGPNILRELANNNFCSEDREFTDRANQLAALLEVLSKRSILSQQLDAKVYSNETKEVAELAAQFANREDDVGFIQSTQEWAATQSLDREFLRKVYDFVEFHKNRQQEFLKQLNVSGGEAESPDNDSYDYDSTAAVFPSSESSDKSTRGTKQHITAVQTKTIIADNLNSNSFTNQKIEVRERGKFWRRIIGGVGKSQNNANWSFKSSLGRLIRKKRNKDIPSSAIYSSSDPEIVLLNRNKGPVSEFKTIVRPADETNFPLSNRQQERIKAVSTGPVSAPVTIQNIGSQSQNAPYTGGISGLIKELEQGNIPSIYVKANYKKSGVPDLNKKIIKVSSMLDDRSLHSMAQLAVLQAAQIYLMPNPHQDKLRAENFRGKLQEDIKNVAELGQQTQGKLGVMVDELLNEASNGMTPDLLAEWRARSIPFNKIEKNAAYVADKLKKMLGNYGGPCRTELLQRGQTKDVEKLSDLALRQVMRFNVLTSLLDNEKYKPRVLESATLNRTQIVGLASEMAKKLKLLPNPHHERQKKFLKEVLEDASKGLTSELLSRWASETLQGDFELFKAAVERATGGVEEFENGHGATTSQWDSKLGAKENEQIARAENPLGAFAQAVGTLELGSSIIIQGGKKLEFHNPVSAAATILAATHGLPPVVVSKIGPSASLARRAIIRAVINSAAGEIFIGTENEAALKMEMGIGVKLGSTKHLSVANVGVDASLGMAYSTQRGIYIRIHRNDDALPGVPGDQLVADTMKQVLNVLNELEQENEENIVLSLFHKFPDISISIGQKPNSSYQNSKWERGLSFVGRFGPAAGEKTGFGFGMNLTYFVKPDVLKVIDPPGGIVNVGQITNINASNLSGGIRFGTTPQPAMALTHSQLEGRDKRGSFGAPNLPSTILEESMTIFRDTSSSTVTIVKNNGCHKPSSFMLNGFENFIDFEKEVNKNIFEYVEGSLSIVGIPNNQFEYQSRGKTKEEKQILEKKFIINQVDRFKQYLKQTNPHALETYASFSFMREEAIKKLDLLDAIIYIGAPAEIHKQACDIYNAVYTAESSYRRTFALSVNKRFDTSVISSPTPFIGIAGERGVFATKLNNIS